jgi:excisionase family DNA binding protein
LLIETEIGYAVRDQSRSNSKLNCPESKWNPTKPIKMFQNSDTSTQMALGNAISPIPIHSELTTQEAADLLNVSRPYLIKQIELDAIPHHKVGTYRQINFNDLMVYKDRIDLATAQGLDEMVAISQELGLYD